MENDYKRNYFWIKRDLKGNKHYYFKIKGQYHEVSEEVPFCPYCLASVYNLLGDTRQGLLSIFSTSPPHTHGFHGNLSDATAW